MPEKANIRNRGDRGFPNILPVKAQSDPHHRNGAGSSGHGSSSGDEGSRPGYVDYSLSGRRSRSCVQNHDSHGLLVSHFANVGLVVDKGNGEISRYSVSGTDTKDLYERPYIGQLEEKQWPVLLELVNKCDPRTIGVNIGSVKWAGGGLTYNLYQQLQEKLPEKYAERLVSAEKAAARWGATLTNREIDLFRQVVEIAHAIIADCFSRMTITPGVTTVDDLVWFYWQRAVDLGLELAFRPYFNIIRSDAAVQVYGAGDRVIRHGDVLHCDVGIKYLRLNSDNQHLAYVLKAGRI